MMKSLRMIIAVLILSLLGTLCPGCSCNNSHTDCPVFGPANLTYMAPSPGNIQLFWTDMANNETGFIVERRNSDPAAGDGFCEIAKLAASSSTYLDSCYDPTLTASENGARSFEYRVKAYNLSSESGYSNTVSAQVSMTCDKCLYVRAGAPAGGDGSDWANAFTGLPDQLQRGYTYFIAAGTYAPYVFDDAVDGNSFIFIKKATDGCHGTDTGWMSASSGFGAGQAEFQPEGDSRLPGGTNDRNIMEIHTDYYDIDGQVGEYNGSEGFNGSAHDVHGFRFFCPPDSDFTSAYIVDIVDPTWSGIARRYVNVRHCEISHRSCDIFVPDFAFTVAASGDRIGVADASVFNPNGTSWVRIDSYSGSGLTVGGDPTPWSGTEYFARNIDFVNNTLQLVTTDTETVVTGMTPAATGTLSTRCGGRGVAGAIENCLIQNCYIHDIPGVNIYIFSTHNTIEYCYVARDHSDPVSHGEALQLDVGTDHNVVRYSVWEDIEGTAILMICDYWEIYGNIFFNSASCPNPGQYCGTFGMGAVASSGNTGSNTRFYNNTCYNLNNVPEAFGCTSVAVLWGNSRGSLFYNNIWVNCSRVGFEYPVIFGDYNFYFSNHSYAYQNAETAQYWGVKDPNDPHTQSNYDEGYFPAGNVTSDPLTGAPAWDFRLSYDTEPGLELPAPYNRDMEGNIRGTGGSWTRGALQY